MRTNHRSRFVSIKRAAAAVALLASASAWAGVQVDVGFGETLSRGNTQGDKNAGVVDVDLGYRYGDMALQAVGIGEINIKRDLDFADHGSPYGFDSFLGGQVVGYLPIVPMFEAYGGLGLGRTRLTNGVRGEPDRHQTDGLLSAGLQWHALGLFTLGAGVDYLTKTNISTASVRMQFGF